MVPRKEDPLKNKQTSVHPNQDACQLAMERGLGTIDYNDNQSNLRVSWQQVHQSNHSLMSHQAEGDRASITSFSPQTHHNKPDEHEKPPEKFDEEITIAEVLSSM